MESLSKIIESYFKISTVKYIGSLGLVDSTEMDTITFIDDVKYINELLTNTKIVAVITTMEISNKLSNVENNLQIFISEDPRFDFYSIQNEVTEKEFEAEKSVTIISPDAKVHPTAFISNVRVKIEKNVEIHPNVTILSDVEIGEGSIIRSGTVLGAEGFEHKRTSKGILSVKHNGKVIIGKRVDIGANCAISKGFSYRNTKIDDDTKLDNLVHVAHGVQIGSRCFLPACCMIAGSTTLGDDVWIGPNASISSQVIIENNAYISIGSVVTKNVAKNEKVTGNFAIPHRQFLKNLKKDLSND